MKNTIRVERAKKRITQKELGAQTGLSNISISKIENGEVDPKLMTAFKIAKFFGLKIQELFSL